MGKSLRQQFEEQGITEQEKDEMRQEVRREGLEPVAARKGVTVEAFRKYAKEELGIPDAPLFTRDFIKPLQVLESEFIHAMYSMWKSIEEDNKRLKDELAKVRQEEGHRNALAKAKLIEMLNAVRVPAR